MLEALPRGIPRMYDKAYRWVAEMEEISDFLEQNPPSHDIYAAIARLYAISPRPKPSRTPGPDNAVTHPRPRPRPDRGLRGHGRPDMPTWSPPLRIGTRGSPMALYQAGLVRDRLRAAHPELAAEGAVELVTIRTTGDRVQDRLLAEIGGKGLFTKEIEEALLDRRIDLAVHSLKDMETVLPTGSRSAACWRATIRATRWCRATAASLGELPHGRADRHGVAAPPGAAAAARRRSRRRADPRQCRTPGSPSSPPASSTRWCWRCAASNGSARPDLASEILSPRGHAAGGRPGRAGDRMPRRRMTAVRQLLAPLNDPATAACVAAERAMLAALDGSCRTPIAGLADDRRRAADARRIVAEAGRHRRASRPQHRRDRRRCDDRRRTRPRVAPPRRQRLRVRHLTGERDESGFAAVLTWFRLHAAKSVTIVGPYR